MHRRVPVRARIGQQTPWRRHRRAIGRRQRRGESPAVQKPGVGRTGQGEQDGSKGRYGEFPGRGTGQAHCLDARSLIAFLHERNPDCDQDHDHEGEEQPAVKDVIGFDCRGAAFEMSQKYDPKGAQSVGSDRDRQRQHDEQGAPDEAPIHHNREKAAKDG